MIDHSQCEHDSTPKARAQCRRARAREEGVEPSTRTRSPRVTKEEEPYGYYKSRTPKDPSKVCMTCKIYPIAYKGTDKSSGRKLYVCNSCSWRIKNADDLEETESK